MQGWRITCAGCGDPLRELQQSEPGTPFANYCPIALEGERLLHDEASGSIRTWISPAALARLLLIRRFVRWNPDRGDDLRARILGLVIPEFDQIAMTEPHNLANSGRPFLPLHLRLYLLVGVATVMREGPCALTRLRSDVLYANRDRLDALAAESDRHWQDVRSHARRQFS
jgi:hypothetical protein